MGVHHERSGAVRVRDHGEGVSVGNKWQELRLYLREICNEARSERDRQVDANDLLIYMDTLDESSD